MLFGEISSSISQHVPLLSLTSASAPVFISIVAARKDFLNIIGEFCDPFIEGEICGDMSIMTSEFLEFYGRSPLVSNLVAVISRVFAIFANYLPTGTLLPEQLLGQALLLVSAFGDLGKSLRVEMKAVSTPTSMREKRAYYSYFGPAGLTWGQFKVLSSLTVDWLDLKKGDSIRSNELAPSYEEKGDFLYWLYQGSVEINSPSSSSSSSFQVTKYREPRLADHGLPCKMGLWGDIDYSLFGITGLSSSSTSTLSSSSTQPNTTSIPSSSTLTSLSDDTKLLRIHVPTLSTIMETDVDLAKAMKTLLYKSTEDKVIAKMMMTMQ